MKYLLERVNMETIHIDQGYVKFEGALIVIDQVEHGYLTPKFYSTAAKGIVIKEEPHGTIRLRYIEVEVEVNDTLYPSDGYKLWKDYKEYNQDSPFVETKRNLFTGFRKVNRIIQGGLYFTGILRHRSFELINPSIRIIRC